MMAAMEATGGPGALVLGLGGTVDYEVRWDTTVVERLAREHGVRRDELTTTAPIIDERSLLVTILAFLDRGDGGERLVASSRVIEGFAERFETRVTLGGTGVRAGLALHRLGIGSVQHLVSIDDTVRRLLPEGIDVICSAPRDSLDPHVIVQYPEGAVVRLPDGEVVSTTANRLIFANDPPNRTMALAVELPAVLASASAFLVSGFNTMQDEALLRSRLDELARAMDTLPDDALVYYEDAGFYERTFAQVVRDRLRSRIDVYGMTEDELGEYVGRPVDVLDPDDVVVALREAHRLIPAPTLVVHSQAWAVAVGPTAAHHLEGLRSAVRMAATRYRLGDTFEAADLEDTDALPRHRRGEEVVAAAVRGIPGAVGADIATPTTIGLGDSFVGGFLSTRAGVRAGRS